MAAAAAAKKQVGTCKWFNSKKGFGFITPTDGSEEVFVHQSAILADGFRSLAEKETVEYDLDKDENGRAKAINVTGPAGAPVKGAPKPRARYYGRKGAEGGAAPAAAAADGSAAPQQQQQRPPRKQREPKAAAAAAPAAAPAAQ